jgi:hypothetical protein
LHARAIPCTISWSPFFGTRLSPGAVTVPGQFAAMISEGLRITKLSPWMMPPTNSSGWYCRMTIRTLTEERTLWTPPTSCSRRNVASCPTSRSASSRSLIAARASGGRAGTVGAGAGTLEEQKKGHDLDRITLALAVHHHREKAVKHLNRSPKPHTNAGRANSATCATGPVRRREA